MRFLPRRRPWAAGLPDRRGNATAGDLSENIDIIRGAVRSAIARRTEAGESQASIARAAGVHPVTLSRWLTGAQGSISTANADRLLLTLGITLRQR